MDSIHAIGPVLQEYGLSRVSVANALDVSTSAVDYWARGIKRVQPQNAIRLETLLGVPRHRTRPDLWSAPAPPPQTIPNEPLTRTVTTPHSKPQRRRSSGSPLAG